MKNIFDYFLFTNETRGLIVIYYLIHPLKNYKCHQLCACTHTTVEPLCSTQQWKPQTQQYQLLQEPPILSLKLHLHCHHRCSDYGGQPRNGICGTSGHNWFRAKIDGSLLLPWEDLTQLHQSIFIFPKGINQLRSIILFPLLASLSEAKSQEQCEQLS